MGVNDSQLIQPIQLEAAANISDELMQKYCDLIYSVTGIRIPQQKKTLMSNRVRRRLRQLNLAGFEDYLKKLKSLPPSDKEWDAFLQEITTHETYLFRDEVHWEWFSKSFLPQISEQARAGKRPSMLRIWSAACSTGDEPFTIATCIANSLPNYNGWKIQIVGTDIGVGALDEAQAAVFNERAMRLVPATCRQRFFAQLPDQKLWQAKPVLKNMIRFRQHNLLDPLREPHFDLVILKNVLIYFDPASKAQVMKQIRSVLAPAGLLLAGAAEGISDSVRDMKRIQPWLFQNPAKS